MAEKRKHTARDTIDQIAWRKAAQHPSDYKQHHATNPFIAFVASASERHPYLFFLALGYILRQIFELILMLFQ